MELSFQCGSTVMYSIFLSIQQNLYLKIFKTFSIHYILYVYMVSITLYVILTVLLLYYFYYTSDVFYISTIPLMSSIFLSYL